MNYAVKQLGPKDIDSAKELIRLFRETFDDVESHQNTIPGDEYLRSMLKNSRFIVLVAMQQEHVVGGLTAHVLDKYEREDKEIYIYDLAVQVQHRRKRIATSLLSNLRQIAGVLGVPTLFVQADISDGAAVRLYEHFGTKRDVFHFDILV